jgi:low temperature requirement protein LtrA
MSEQKPPKGVEESDRSVKPFELFFDLVFVYAFTQTTALLAHDLTFMGLMRGGLVISALWLAWQSYTWMGTSFDLDEGAVRIAIVVVMGVMLIAGLAVPGAFGADAVMFAIAYAFVRVLQPVLILIVARKSDGFVRAVMKLLPNFTIGPALILFGSVSEIGPLELWWIASLAIEYGTMLLVDTSGWKVSAGHFSERHGLIFIIALGEVVISIGIGASGLALDEEVIIPSLLGFWVIVAMWWSYFDVNAMAAERRLHSVSGGAQVTLAQHAYTYLHLPMVGGAILFSLAVKKILAHAYEPLSLIPTIALSGGLAIFLLAQVLFTIRCGGPVSKPRLVIAALLLLAIPISDQFYALVLLLTASGLFGALVVVEVLVDREARHKIRSNEHYTWARE